MSIDTLHKSHLHQTMICASHPPTNDELNEFMPPGWRKDIIDIVMGIIQLCSVMIDHIAVKNGVLYILFSDHQNKINLEIAKLAATALMQKSARTCMICGAAGRRRKDQDNSPVFCRKHYLEYINREE